MDNKKYGFNKGIFIAYGATGSCIYDLRESFAKIHRLDKDATELVRSVTTSDDYIFSDREMRFLSSLIDRSFLIANHEDIKINYESTEQTITSRVAWIEVTEKCQLRCSYCYGSFCAQKQKTLSTKDIEHLFYHLSHAGFTIFRLIGGEPLLYKNTVINLVSKLSEINNSRIELYTNGLLLTEDFLAFCKEHDIKLAIGIFGADDIECMNVTGSRNVFKRQVDIINIVRRSGVAYRLSITRIEANSSASKEQLAGIYKFPVELLREDQVKSIGRATSSADLKKTSLKRIKKEHFSHKFQSAFIRKNISDGHSCYKNKICITASLDVHPCIMERSIVYGNLRCSQLVDVLKAGAPFMGASKDSVSTCKDCEYRYACFDCRVDRILPNDFYSKSSNCGYNPHTGIWVD